MLEQNFKNHSRLIPLYHGVAFLLAIAGLIGSIINLFDHDDPGNHYSAALLVVVFILIIIILWYARTFVLKVQDRAIRAEENFRHFILTGKPLDKQLSLAQIIGLRFASDEEFAALAIRAVAENLTQKQIKQAVQNWRADHNRA